MKTQILFVCLGNICRSPAAEGVMQHLVASKGLAADFFIDSAGTAAYHTGEQADPRMRKHSEERGYTLGSIARKVRTADFETFDYIVAMDNSNYDRLYQLAPSDEARKKLYRMVDFAPNCRYKEVPDPYYGGADGFELVLDILENATKGLLADIQSKNDAH